MARKSESKQQLKIFYDQVGNTLTVWLDDPKKEHISEETDDDVVLMKDKAGRVIGFEKLNVKLDPSKVRSKTIPIEVMAPTI